MKLCSAKAAHYLVHKGAHKVDETTLHLWELFGTVSVHHGLRKTEETVLDEKQSEKKKTTNKRTCEEKARGPYNWLLVQNTSLQISLFPEFSSYHQSHLESNTQTDE